MYAIVDIETTGGSAQKSRITEIAIILHNGSQIIEEFTSLVNPECYIPSGITQLTGITNQMVESAPRFFEIARKVVEITEGAVFVAHNAQFDYKFIKEEFKRLGYDYSRNTLCTVKLTKKIFPGYPSYSLGNICTNLGIPVNSRHRAMGDAAATAKLFEMLFATNSQLIISSENGNESAAPNIDIKKIKNLPEATGVYYFYNQAGDIIYIGKSVNIRQRVLSHLSPKTKRAAEMLTQLYDVGFELTGSDLIAIIHEADSIKEHLPKFNKRGRRKVSPIGLFSYFDIQGYINLKLGKIDFENEPPITSFDNPEQAQQVLYKLVEKYSLCQKLCGLYKSEGACFHYQIAQCQGACVGVESSDTYNQRVQKALSGYSLGEKSFLLIDEGRDIEEKSFIKVRQGRIEGYGFFNPNYIQGLSSLLEEQVTRCGNHLEALQALRDAIQKKGIKVIPFQ
jgi:DNA polymerase III subunit epsilon